MYTGIDPVRAIEMVQQSPLIAFDCETTGLTIHDKVVGWVFTDAHSSVYVPTHHQGGGNIPHGDEFERVLGLAFKDRARRKHTTVGHNLGFDLRMAAKHGVCPEYPLEDTMINEGLINDIVKGHSLENCCERHNVTRKLGAELYKSIASKFGGIPDRNTMQHFHKMAGDDPVVVEYATGDGIATLALRDDQQKYLDERDLRRAWELECKLIHRVARLHHRGLRIDMEYADELRKPTGIISSKISEAQSRFTPGFNTNSTKEVESLYRANGYSDSDFARTDTGLCSFTESWLKNNEIGQAILAVRQLKKARDSFITPLAETHNVRGRVHPVLNQSKSDEYGVIGARFSCSDPNLQAFPKRNKDVGRIVRRLVVADPDYEIQEGDAKQQEPRLFAYFSGDERLLGGYRRGDLDLHDQTSTGLRLDRDTAKRMGMGLLTGMSAPTLAKHMGKGMTLEQAEKYWGAFFDMFPGVRDFHVKAKAIFRGTGYVRSLTGRRAHLDDPKFAYRAISRIIQNSGGDHIKTCLLRASEYAEANPEVQLLLTIHDSVLWQRRIGFDTTELVKALENVAEEFNLGVPIPFEVGTGQNWAEASYGK